MKRPMRKAKNGDETPYEKAQRVVGIQQRNANVEKARQVVRQTAMNLDKKRVELKEKGPEKPNSKDVVTVIKNGQKLKLTSSSIKEALKKGGIMKTKMKTGGMVNPNKKATVTTKATKYTGGKNGTMMKGKGTKKK